MIASVTVSIGDSFKVLIEGACTCVKMTRWLLRVLRFVDSLELCAGDSALGGMCAGCGGRRQTNFWNSLEYTNQRPTGCRLVG
jgi:hypothetical protein